MELDARMTEETKAFVPIALNLAPLVADPINVGRQAFEAISEQNIKRFTFENIEEKPFLVDSLYDQHKIPVTAFIPKTVKPTSGIVVFYHGGGLCTGSIKTHRNPVAYLSDHSNKIWVSVDYRLSPESKHPIPLQDCISAARWVVENKMKLFNASSDAKVGVLADSAGGFLAASVAIQLKDLLAFQVEVYSLLDFTCSSEYYKELGQKAIYLLTEADTRNNISLYLNDTNPETLKNTSPVHSKHLAGSPSALIIGAELDPLIGDSYLYHKRLQEAGVSSELFVVKGAVHGFFFAFLDYKNAFIECAVEILKFLNRF